MAGFIIRAPRGEQPILSARLLDANKAQIALNCRFTSGRLEPLRNKRKVFTAAMSGIKTIYRYRSSGVDNWLTFDRNVDVVRSPVSNDHLGRLFWTGDGEPRMTTYDDAIEGDGPYPDAWFVLGVAPPVTAPTVNVTGGSGTTESRAYVYTFRTRFGEESGPSPATVATGFVNGTWNMSDMDAAPPNSGTVMDAVADTPNPLQVEVELDSVFGLEVGEEVTFADVEGMTALNGKHILIAVDKTTAKVVVSLATAQVYTSGGTWARVAPHNTDGMMKAIYRTVGTNADYRFVDEIPASTTTYGDVIPATTVSLNAGIQTLDTLPPPKNLTSLVLLSNNALAGISGNEVCLSEQGKPYSWPLSNRYSFPGEGRKLIASGNSAIILTDNFPHVLTATVPEAGSVAKLQSDAMAPCVSGTGAVDVGGSAVYPSNDGLYLATLAGVRKLSAQIFDFEQWQDLNPASFIAAFHDGTYYACMLGPEGIGKTLMIEVAKPDSVSWLNDIYPALHANPLDGYLYVCDGQHIYRWDDANSYMTFLWRSKDFQFPKQINLGAAQLHARYQDIVPVDTSDLDFNIALMEDYRDTAGEIGCHEVLAYEVCSSALIPVDTEQLEGFLQVTLLAGGNNVFTKRISSSKAFKLPGKKKSELYAVEFSGRIGLESAAFAEGMAELGTMT